MLKASIIVAGFLTASIGTASASTQTQTLNIGGSRNITIAVHKDVDVAPYAVTGSKSDSVRLETVYLATRSVTVRQVTDR